MLKQIKIASASASAILEGGKCCLATQEGQWRAVAAVEGDDSVMRNRGGGCASCATTMLFPCVTADRDIPHIRDSLSE